MRLDSQTLPAVLQALSDQIRYVLQRLSHSCLRRSALQALGLVQRTTRDVDVLALVEAGGGVEPVLVTSDPLPTVLVEAARDVGQDFNLPPDWLNAGPADLLREGLPKGVRPACIRSSTATDSQYIS
jgi:hypothetical protein